ncbi:unnamed protein product [Scytosiphon promiscuus]
MQLLPCLHPSGVEKGYCSCQKRHNNRIRVSRHHAYTLKPQSAPSTQSLSPDANPTMPSTNDPGDKVGLQKTLDNLFIGTVLVPARQITLTTIGRAQRASGVRQLQDAIRENGFLASHAPLCCVLESLPLAELEEASSKGRLPPIKAIDGNHRIAAALANDQDALIPVRVHNPMTPMEEMMVAEGMNQVDANLVERCLVDEIIWMKNIIRFCQQEGGCNLGANALAARITAHYKKQNRKSPAKATLLRKIELITGLKPLALQAWKKSVQQEHQLHGGTTDQPRRLRPARGGGGGEDHHDRAA